MCEWAGGGREQWRLGPLRARRGPADRAAQAPESMADLEVHQEKCATPSG